MKIIRPENIIKPIEIPEPQSIDDVMDNVLKESMNTIEFKIILTKKQYDIWTEKGGLSWLKMQLAKK